MIDNRLISGVCLSKILANSFSLITSLSKSCKGVGPLLLDRASRLLLGVLVVDEAPLTSKNCCCCCGSLSLLVVLLLVEVLLLLFMDDGEEEDEGGDVKEERMALW